MSILNFVINPAYPPTTVPFNVAPLDVHSVNQYNKYYPEFSDIGIVKNSDLQTPDIAQAVSNGIGFRFSDTDINQVVLESSTPEDTVYSINTSSLNNNSVRKSDNIDQSKEMHKELDPLVYPYEEPSLLKGLDDGIPMFFEMVDSAGTKQSVVIPDKYTVQALKLTPNPETLTISSGKKVNRYTTLTGWVEEHWGDEIDSVSFNGSTFSFLTLENGLTNRYRDQSSAYNFLKKLINLYQVNGCIYQGGNDYQSIDNPSVQNFLKDNPEFINNHPRKGMIKERLYIKLYYDFLIMYGRFETFDIIEDSSIPFRFKYNIIFKAERTIYNLDNTDLNTNNVWGL